MPIGLGPTPRSSWRLDGPYGVGDRLAGIDSLIRDRLMTALRRPRRR